MAIDNATSLELSLPMPIQSGQRAMIHLDLNLAGPPPEILEHVFDYEGATKPGIASMQGATAIPDTRPLLKLPPLPIR